MDFGEIYFKDKTFRNPEAYDYYRRIIGDFTHHFKPDLSDLTTSRLNDYLTSEFTKSKTNKKYSFKTYEKNLNIIRAFLNHLYKTGNVKYDFAKHIRKSNQDYQIQPTELPTVDEILTVINYLKSNYESDKSYSTLRDLVIFNLTFHSGITNNGIASIKDNSLYQDGSNHHLVVTLPKLRNVAINNSDAALIKELINKKNEITDSPSLFISQKTKKGIVKRTVGFFFAKLCDDCNINSYASSAFIKAGMIAALIAGYDIERLSYDVGLQTEYMKRRVKDCLTDDSIQSYSDLFNENNLIGGGK